MVIFFTSSFAIAASSKKIVKQEVNAQKSCVRRDAIVKKFETFQTNIANQDKERNNIVAQLQKLESNLNPDKKQKVEMLLVEIATRTQVISDLRISVVTDYSNLENDLCSAKTKIIKNEQVGLKTDIANLNKEVASFKSFVKVDLKKQVKNL